MRQHRGTIEACVRTIVRECKGLNTDDREAALATYIVSEIERLFPARSIGRSLLQKLFFVLSNDGHIDASFDLFINGPYSDRVESILSHAVELGMLTVSKENGRSGISARGGIPFYIPPKLKEEVSRSIRYYGFYEEGDLAILTTALFLEHRGFEGLDEMIKAVIAVNPHFELRRVCSLLDRSDVVYRSW